MKALFRRIWYCRLRGYHWTHTSHGYYPAQWATCSGCGTLLFGPHEIQDAGKGERR